MKNLACYTNDSFTAFTDAVSRKKDLLTQARLMTVYASIQLKFINYDMLFAANELEFLVNDGVHKFLQTELQSLYNSDNALVNEIRREVENLQPRAYRYTCQYCTLEKPNTMDHIVPQSEFPEFAIHPKNLIPSCSTCNGYKGARWRVGNDKNLINFYTDQLPNYQYLEVTIYKDQFGELNFRYQLKYPPGMNLNLYQLISRHFTKLHLFERMRKSAITDLTEFEDLIKPRYQRGETRASLEATTIETCGSLRAALGLNHWKPVMMEALVRSNIFWDRITV